MSTTDEPPTMKTRRENERTNDVSSTVMQFLQDMLQTERVLLLIPFSVTNRNENVEDGSTLTISNVRNVNNTINKTPTRQDTRENIKNNVMISNNPQELKSKVLFRSLLLYEDTMGFFYNGIQFRQRIS